VVREGVKNNTHIHNEIIGSWVLRSAGSIRAPLTIYTVQRRGTLGFRDVSVNELVSPSPYSPIRSLVVRYWQ